jgi:predicted RND superfamily exporter protein
MAAQSLQGRIAALQDAQIDYEAEAELAKIEQRLGMRPSTDSVAASAATTPVDDSDALRELEELERKLQAAQGESNAQSGS